MAPKRGFSITRRGVGVGVLSAALVLLGALFDYVELIILGTAGLVALFAAVLVCLRPWRLEVSRQVDPVRVVAGEQCLGVLSIRNAGTKLGIDVLVTDRCRYRGNSEAVPVPILRLARNEQSDIRYELPTTQRGVISIGPLVAERSDLFSLTRTYKEYGDIRQVWVHPRARVLQGIPTGMVRSLDGRTDKVEHGSITFHALREYVMGDDLRHVHWRTSARVGTLMVREHVDTSLPRVVLVVDDRASAYAQPEDVEVAVEAAASVAVATLNAGLAVDLYCVAGPSGEGMVLSSGSTYEGKDAFLDVLTELELRDNGSMSEAARRLRQNRGGDTLVFFTGSSSAAELGVVAGVKDLFPSIMVTTVGSKRHVANELGMLVVGVRNVDDFVGAWDGVRSW